MDSEEPFARKGSKDSQEPLLNGSSLRSTKGHRTGKFVYILTFFAAVGGFLFGYDTGVVSGALIILKKHFHLSFLMEELVVSITIAAAILGALLGGPTNHYFGRKIVLLIASFVFTVGAVCMGIAQSTDLLLVGRGIVGVGIGELS